MRPRQSVWVRIYSPTGAVLPDPPNIVHVKRDAEPIGQGLVPVEKVDHVWLRVPGQSVAAAEWWP